MATDKQKAAARQNLEKAREAQSARAHGANVPHSSEGLSTAEKDELGDQEFAFPAERKEPLTDAQHVRNAVARFDQVADVSDEDRVLAFANIEKAAEYYDVRLSETSWHDLGAHPQR